MIVQLPYVICSDEAEKRRHELERQLIDDNNCSILHVDDIEEITYLQERGAIK